METNSQNLQQNDIKYNSVSWYLQFYLICIEIGFIFKLNINNQSSNQSRWNTKLYKIQIDTNIVSVCNYNCKNVRKMLFKKNSKFEPTLLIDEQLQMKSNDDMMTMMMVK